MLACWFAGFKAGRAKIEETWHHSTRYRLCLSRSVQKVPGAENLADILTKPLAGALFLNLGTRLTNTLRTSEGVRSAIPLSEERGEVMIDVRG